MNLSKSEILEMFNRRYNQNYKGIEPYSFGLNTVPAASDSVLTPQFYFGTVSGSLPVDGSGSYIRIQLAGLNFLTFLSSFPVGALIKDFQQFSFDNILFNGVKTKNSGAGTDVNFSFQGYRIYEL